VHDDLEREGYEVQSFLIPAASVGAPHQRYRVWFVAYSYSNNDKREVGGVDGEKKRLSEEHRQEHDTTWKFRGTNFSNATNTESIGQEYALENGELERGRFRKSNQRNFWDSFPSKSPLCGGDDGLPKELDNITFSKWRQESIKAYGNAIVPQVAHQIFKTIEEFEKLV
jgi:DNA (cytosine-5)-methyltransferase 1